IKTRKGYDLASTEGKTIQDVQEIYPEWQPEEPRPFVVFSEWKLPVDDNDHGRNYFIRFRFPMRTRDDLILDAIPMTQNNHGSIGPCPLNQCKFIAPPVAYMEAQTGR
ncbi:hypothetical protein NPIL_449801, partial [Nephila pilipes]